MKISILNIKKILFYFLFICLASNAVAQNVFYRATSNIIVANDHKSAIHIEMNYQVNITQAQLIYNLSDTYFIFGAYNFDNTSINYSPFLGKLTTREKNNSGFSFGAGIQKLGNIGKYTELELLAGFEQQKVNNYEYFANSPELGKDHLIQDYYKIFTQFNMIKSRADFDLGYSLKLSYFRLTKFNFNSQRFPFEGKSLLFLDPTINLNLKLLPKKNLILSSQVGISTALSNLNSERSNEEFLFTEQYTQYISAAILKIGIQYRFNKK